MQSTRGEKVFKGGIIGRGMKKRSGLEARGECSIRTSRRMGRVLSLRGGGTQEVRVSASGQTFKGGH